MIAASHCHLTGHWRIVEAELWDRSHLDLVEPAMIMIGVDGHGEIAFGALQAASISATAKTWCTSRGPDFEEMDEVSGDGHAELLDDGIIELTFAYHNGN